MTRSVNRRRLGAWALALVAARAAAPAAARASQVHTVVMDRMRFGPTPSDVRVGDVILWDNRDMFRHTATARNRSFDIDLAAKSSGRTVIRKAGRIDFYCKFHPGMTGVLSVKP